MFICPQRTTRKDETFSPVELCIVQFQLHTRNRINAELKSKHRYFAQVRSNLFDMSDLLQNTPRNGQSTILKISIIFDFLRLFEASHLPKVCE